MKKLLKYRNVSICNIYRRKTRPLTLLLKPFEKQIHKLTQRYKIHKAHQSQNNPCKVYLSRSNWSTFLVLMLLGSAHAEEGDGFKLIAATSVRHDSNLFRLSSTANPTSLIGKNSPAETIYTNTLGFNYDKMYSLQRIELGINLIDYRYQNFNYLDFSALNYRAIWHWSYTPYFHGNLTTTRDKTLNSFSDFQGFNQRNEKINTTTRLDGIYELDTRWRLLGALSQYAQTNRQPLTTESGSRQNIIDVGVRYVLPSDSYISFTLHPSHGTYTDLPPSVANLKDSKFSQNESNVELLWVISTKTTADFQLGYMSRTHPNFSQRNFSGPIGSARVNWTISAKSAISTSWTRSLTANQTSSTNFSQSDRFDFGPVWQIGSKTKLSMLLGSTVSNYGGIPGITTTSQRRDLSRNASLSLIWKPQKYMTVNASLENTRRSSNTPGLDFNNNSIAISTLLSF